MYRHQDELIIDCYYPKPAVYISYDAQVYKKKVFPTMLGLQFPSKSFNGKISFCFELHLASLLKMHHIGWVPFLHLVVGLIAIIFNLYTSIYFGWVQNSLGFYAFFEDFFKDINLYNWMIINLIRNSSKKINDKFNMWHLKMYGLTTTSFSLYFLCWMSSSEGMSIIVL